MPSDIFISPEDLPLLADSPDEVPTMTPELKVKCVKEQRDNLDLAFAPERTYLLLVAVNKEEHRNTISRIACKKGLPIGGYVYDATSDSYAICCADYVQLGYIPVSMVMRVNGQHNYQIRVPLAEAVIKRFLSPAQKKDARTFRATYKPEEHYLQFIQMLDCNG